MYFEGNRMSISTTATTPSIFRHTVCPAVSTRRTRVVLVQILVGEVSTAATRYACILCNMNIISNSRVPGVHP
jgi:hypothetical protein